MQRVAPRSPQVTLRTEPTQDTRDRNGRRLACVNRSGGPVQARTLRAGWVGVSRPLWAAATSGRTRAISAAPCRHPRRYDIRYASGFWRVRCADTGRRRAGAAAHAPPPGSTQAPSMSAAAGRSASTRSFIDHS